MAQNESAFTPTIPLESVISVRKMDKEARNKIHTSVCSFPCSAGREQIIGWIQIIGKCNLKCVYCYTDSSPLSSDQLSFEEIKRILNEYAQLKAGAVVISGGEPTLRRDLADILKYSVQEAGLKTLLVTNGTRLTRSLIQLLADLDIETQLSIDAITAEAYEKTRGAGANVLARVKRNIALMQEIGAPMSLSITITTQTEYQLEACIDFAMENGIDSLHVNPMVPTGRGLQRPDLVPSLYPILRKLYDLQTKYYQAVGIDIVENLLAPLAFKIKKTHYCNAMAGGTLEVGPNGDIYFCGYMADYDAMVAGNIRQSSLVDIYHDLRHNAAFPDLSVDQLKRCRDCELRYICSGGCRALAYYASGGDIFATSPYCDDMKKIIPEILTDYDAGKLDDYFAFMKERSNMDGASPFAKLF